MSEFRLCTEGYELYMHWSRLLDKRRPRAEELAKIMRDTLRGGRNEKEL